MKYVFGLFVLLYACNPVNNSSENNVAVDTVKLATVDSVYAWESGVLMFGDSIAYGKLALELSFVRNDHWALLYYAQLMCNKYNYADACLDCYKINCDILSPDNLKAHDSITCALGRYYLLKAYELGSIDADAYVKKYFEPPFPHTVNLTDRVLWRDSITVH